MGSSIDTNGLASQPLKHLNVPAAYSSKEGAHPATSTSADKVVGGRHRASGIQAAVTISNGLEIIDVWDIKALQK
jgi:hypothetical protein